MNSVECDNGIVVRVKNQEALTIRQKLKFLWVK